MMGDRTTMGSLRAAQEAKSLGVSLEIQPGQNRISWEPEELVFDLSHYTASGEKTEVVEESKAKDLKSKSKTSKELPAASVSSQTQGQKTIKDRLKELDQLKKDEMITDKEYQQKRKELLQQL